MNRTLQLLRCLFPPTCHQSVFLVGGSVRDYLLDRESRDIDLVAALMPEQLTACGFRLVQGKSTSPIWFRHDPAFGTVEVTPLDEVTGLNADLSRRDFTINAMAMNLSGELLDPLQARGDLDSGLLRACSNRSFMEDPLRIFRAFRFEADGWRLSEEGAALILEHDWSNSFDRIPMERFSREMLKALAAPWPGRFFQRMLQMGVGRLYLPEIFHMPEVPAGPLTYHPEGDLCTHSLQVLERVSLRSDSPMARFCALFHDIGKLGTNPADYPSHHHHGKTGFEMARILSNRLRLPAAFGTALAWTCRLHGNLNNWDDLRASTKVKTAEQALKAGIAEILPLVSIADKAGATEPPDWSQTVQAARMTTAELGLDVEMASVPALQRRNLILQKRVEYLRTHSRSREQTSQVA